MNRTFLLVALVGTSTIALIGPASAATSADIADDLIDRTSDVLDIEITDPDLLSELSDDLGYAIDSDIVDPKLSDDIARAIESDTEPDGVDEQLESNIIEQIRNWEQYAPDYRQVFETVRTEFQTCREASASASACAMGLGFKIQVAMASDSLERLRLLEQQILDGGATLTAEELAALEEERALLIARIERANALLEKFETDDPQVQNARNDMARIRTEAADFHGAAESPSNSRGSVASGNKGPAGSTPSGNGSSGSANPGTPGGGNASKGKAKGRS